MKVLRCYGTTTCSVLYTRGLELSALPDGDMLDRLAKHDSRGVTSPSREGLLCLHTGRGQRRSGDLVEGRMKDRSGDEVSNSAGSVVAARQPRLGLLRTPYGDSTRPDQTRPGRILPSSACYSHCSDDTILSYTSSSTFVLVLGHNKPLETRPGLID